MAEERETSINTDLPEFDFEFGNEDLPGQKEIEEVNTPPTDVTPDVTPPVKPDEQVTPPVTKEPTVLTPPDDTADKADDATTPDTDVMPKGADPMAYGIYKTMVENGHWLESEEFKGSMEEVSDMFEQMPDMMFNSMVDAMPPVMKNLMTYGYQKGEALKESDLAEFFTKYNTVSSETVDLDSTEGQRDYLKKVLISDGEDADTAEDLLDLWEDKGKLASKATAKHSAEKAAKEEAAQEEITRLASQKAQAKESRKAFVQNVQKNIVDTGWKPKAQRAVLDEIFEGRLNHKSKVISNHPKALVQLANYLRYFDEEKGEIDESAYKTQAFSASAKNVKSTIEKHFAGIPQSAARAVPKRNEEDKQSFEFVD